MAARRSFYVDAPVETVFEFARTLRWLDTRLMEVRNATVTEDGTGTNFGWAVKIGGLWFTGFDVFTEVIQNQRIIVRSTGAFPSTWVYLFEPEGLGTRCTAEFRPESFWRIKPLNRLAELGFGMFSQAFMPRYKQRVEARGGQPWPAQAGNGARRPADGQAKALQRSIHIEAPVETVFDSLFDSFRDPAKLRDLMQVNAQVDDMNVTREGAGTYISWHMKVAGLPVRGFDVLTDVVPGRHITDRSSSAMVGTWDYDFEPEGSGTKLTLVHRSRSVWRIPPLRSLTDLAADKVSDSLMLRVKETIEAPGN